MRHIAAPAFGTGDQEEGANGFAERCHTQRGSGWGRSRPCR
jgi:hypothetical protein